MVISKLENKALTDVQVKLATLAQQYRERSDDISDLCHDQLTITVDEDDKETFRNAIQVLSMTQDMIEDLANDMRMLVEHFRQLK